MLGKFNIIIRGRHFHEMHHALGCPWPKDVMGETYRNYFACDAGCETGRRMKASDHWSGGSEGFGSTCFFVTESGRKALLEYLNENFDTPAIYAVTYHDVEGESLHPAKSRSAAKYAAYRCSETEMPLIDYIAEIKSVKRRHKARFATTS